MENLKKYLG